MPRLQFPFFDIQQHDVKGKTFFDGLFHLEADAAPR